MSDEPRTPEAALAQLRAGFENRGLCHILERRAEGRECDCPLCLIDLIRSGLSAASPPDEVVRAWVARDRGKNVTGLYFKEPRPSDMGDGFFWLTIGWCSDLPTDLFPTLLPGACWPVEIRRIKE